MEGMAARTEPLPRSPGRRIIRREEAQSWIDGYRFLEEARRAADVLTHGAQAAFEAERARGFEQGRSAGVAEAAALLAETRQNVDRYLASIESQVAELSLSIVERVLGRLGDAEVVVQAARQALESFRREKSVTIRVAPQVVEEVQRELVGLAAVDAGGSAIVVEADPKLTPRQCTVATEFAVVDATIDVQLAAIRRALLAGPQGAA